MLIETESRNIETKIRTFETENETETGLVTLTSLERTRSVFSEITGWNFLAEFLLCMKLFYFYVGKLKKTS